MRYCSECGFQFTSGIEKFCPNCGFEDNKPVTVSVAGKEDKTTPDYWKLGDSNLRIEISSIEAGPEFEPEYRTSLLNYFELIEEYSKNLSGVERESLNESINALAKLVEGRKAGEIVKDDEAKNEIKSILKTLAEKIVNYLPQAAESIASAIPLATFGVAIGKRPEYFADLILRIL